MNEYFRRRSIPPRTGLDAFRERKSIGYEGNPLKNSVKIDRLSPDLSRQNRPKQNWDVVETKRHVFNEPKNLFAPPEIEKTTSITDIVENCNSQGDLDLIMQFFGIDLRHAVFTKNSVNYGADSAVFYVPIHYNKKGAFLILSTFGDIFESQVVATKLDERPFFREETLLPPLTVTHDPSSMTVYEENHLVVVSL